MNKREKLLQAFIDIDTASEISYATLSELSENCEDERVSYIILGVMEQIEKIKKTAEMIDEAMREKAVAA